MKIMGISEEYVQIRHILDSFKSSVEAWKLRVLDVQCEKTYKNFTKSFIHTLLELTDSCRNLEILFMQAEERSNVLEKNIQLLECDKQKLCQELSNLQTNYAKTQLNLHYKDTASKDDRLGALCEEISKLKSDLVESKQQNASTSCELEETSVEMAKTKEELCTLTEEKCDLEITIAESDVYCQALQEQVDELEDICSTMRLQREEQIHYYSQRESLMKQNFEEQQDEVLKEKADVAAKLMQLTTDHVLIKDEIEHLTDARNSWIHEKNTLINTIHKLEEHVKQLQNELKHQQECTSKLMKKNHKTSTWNDGETGNLNKNYFSVNEITENVKKMIDGYLEERTEAQKFINSEKVADLQKQVVHLKVDLQKEKDKHQLQQTEITQLRISLEKASRRAFAGTQASLNSSHSLKQRLDLKPSGQLVDDIFSIEDLSWDNQSSDTDILLVKEIGVLESPSNTLEQVALADKAAIEMLQKLEIM